MMFHEITRQHINVNKREEIYFSYNNFVAIVRHDKCLYFISFSNNLECLDKKLDLVVRTLSAPTHSPASKFFQQGFAQETLSNMEVTQMITEPVLWPHNNQLLHEVTNVSMFEWSPSRFMHNNHSNIATLNTAGNIDLIVPNRHGWAYHTNLSLLMKGHLRSVLPTDVFEVVPKNLQELRHCVNSVTASALCWAPQLNEDSSCYFVTAQKNSILLFWSLKYVMNEIKVEYRGGIYNNDSEILGIKWITQSKNKFLLVCSNIHGQLLVYECKINNQLLFSSKLHELWKHKDKIVIKHVTHTIHDSKIVLACSKHRHLVVLLIDENCNVLSQYVTVVNDYKIVSIINAKTNFILGTVNVEVYEINYSIQNESLDVNLSQIKFKDTNTTHELYGLGISNSNSLLIAALIDRRISFRKETIDFEIVYYCREPTQSDNMLVVLNNETKRISLLWDEVHVIRYKTMKLRSLPDIDYNKLYDEGSEDAYKLRVYYIMLIFYNNLEKIIRNESQVTLPETSLENVKEKIMVINARDLAKKIYEKRKTGETLSNLESESLSGAVKYLTYYCGKNEKPLSEFMPAESLVSDYFEYTCQCCDEKIELYSCKSNHLNMFCSVTFTPIETDNYLVCNVCNATARLELNTDEPPMCIFCDFYLEEYQIK